MTEPMNPAVDIDVKGTAKAVGEWKEPTLRYATVIVAMGLLTWTAHKYIDVYKDEIEARLEASKAIAKLSAAIEADTAQDAEETQALVSSTNESTAALKQLVEIQQQLLIFLKK